MEKLYIQIITIDIQVIRVKANYARLKKNDKCK